MKSAVRLFCLALLLMPFFCGCTIRPNREIPAGYINKEEHIDLQGGQDFTDYCKYYYPNDDVSVIHNNYRTVDEADIEDIQGYFSDFARWMETEGREDDYDFDSACITPGDYVRIRTKEGTPIGDSYYQKYDDYTLWFFDTESCTLYYIHTNI